MKILILEDQPKRIEFFKSYLEDDNELIITTTVEEAIGALEASVAFDQAFLDHDLLPAYQEFYSTHSSLRVIDYIVKQLPPIGYITIHSINIHAARKMKELLTGANYTVDILPFNHLKQRWEEMRKLSTKQMHLIDMAMDEDPSILGTENIPSARMAVIEAINTYENMDSDIDRYITDRRFAEELES